MDVLLTLKLLAGSGERGLISHAQQFHFYPNFAPPNVFRLFLRCNNCDDLDNKSRGDFAVFFIDVAKYTGKIAAFRKKGCKIFLA